MTLLDIKQSMPYMKLSLKKALLKLEIKWWYLRKIKDLKIK